MWKSLINATWDSSGSGPWVELSTRPSTRAQNAKRLRSSRGLPLVHQGIHEGSPDAPRLPATGLWAMIVSDPCAHISTNPHSSKDDSAALTRHSRG
jgi:hypothetical protein